MPSAGQFSPQRAAAEWIGRCIQTRDEGQTGALGALMLQRIAGNMDAMPEIHEEMQTMNSSMQAMPVVTAEMQ